MARTFLACLAACTLLAGAASAQTPPHKASAYVWQMILKATSTDLPATINPILMERDVCLAAITNISARDYHLNNGVCLNVTTGEVFGVSD